MTHTEEQIFTVALILAMILMALASAPAGAQVPTYQGARVRRGDDVVLAIMCSGERSPMHLDTCTTMIDVVARTAAQRGISVGAQARAYSAVFRVRSRPWLREPNARGARPPSWPRASWSRYRTTWLRLLAHVRALLRGEVEGPCAETPTHFGNRADGRRMGAWVQMCAHVDSRQLFWGRR